MFYGVVDIGIEVINNVFKIGGGSVFVVCMQLGNQLGLCFGLCGVEDLGGGMKVFFQLENGFNFDIGMLVNGIGSILCLFGCSVYVGLQGSVGIVMFGCQDVFIYDFVKMYDLMGVGVWYFIILMDLVFVQCIDNLIKYFGIFGGLIVEVNYSIGWDVGFGGEILGVSKVG